MFAEIENARRELYARRDTFECSIEDPLDPTTVPPAERQVVVDPAFVDGSHRLEPTVRYDAMIRRHGDGTGVIVHDDIRWSTEMDTAWRSVRDDSGARQVFDLFRMGVIELGPAEVQSRPVSAWMGVRS